MHSFRILRSWALLSVALWLGWQDPQPASQDPQPKSSKEQDPKGQDSGAKKLIGAPKRNPLEGVYRLTERVVNGVTDKRDTRGYVAITGRYLFLNLATPGLTQEHPLVHAP